MKAIQGLILVILLASCGGDRAESVNAAGMEYKSFAESDGEEMVMREDAQTTAPQQGKEQKLIKTGNLNYKVDEIQKEQDRLLAIVKAHKGYVSSENTYRNDYRVSQNMQIRIPATHFDQVLKEIEVGVEFFENKSVNVSDVSEEYYDLEARLKTKKALEQRYMDLLNSAKSVSEILEVERELYKVIEEIESVEGRFKYLNDQVGMSTLNIGFYTTTEDRGRFGYEGMKSLSRGWEHFKSFVLWFIAQWPFLIVIGFLWFLVRRRWKRRG
ncbi:DUF4349 domain-containing protein [bacterium]|nr:DUF4349 domain-containing protein [bacterium]